MDSKWAGNSPLEVIRLSENQTQCLARSNLTIDSVRRETGRVLLAPSCHGTAQPGLIEWRHRVKKWVKAI